MIETLFLRKVTKLTKSLPFQKIKWERVLAKLTASIVESILIWVHHHPTGGLGLTNQGKWTLH